MAPAAGDARLARYHLPILDDPAHVGKDQVLFELVPAGCGRRSLMITAGRVFPERDRILPDRTMAVAAAGRPVHRAVIPGMIVESCRRRTAFETRKRGRPASRATRKNTQTGRAGISRDMRPAAPVCRGPQPFAGFGRESACSRREIRKISALSRRRTVILIDVRFSSGLSPYSVEPGWRCGTCSGRPEAGAAPERHHRGDAETTGIDHRARAA